MAKVGAFDAPRPPDRELVDVCVHCGFCLPTCPTYLLWNEEMDSPRGRIVLMNTALEDADQLSDSMVTHWDRCLGCMACVTACPSGVKYDQLIETTRPQGERNYPRSFRDRAFKRFAFEAFTHPGPLRALQSLLPDVAVKAAVGRLPEVTPALGTPRGRVGLLLGCVQRVFFGDVN